MFNLETLRNGKGEVVRKAEYALRSKYKGNTRNSDMRLVGEIRQSLFHCIMKTI